MTFTGKVFIVGAGPGDPDLITVRGLRALQGADVVLYDRLANPALLREIPPHAKTIYVGKGPGYQAFSQAQIEYMLIEEARLGQMVVRLKGGDPFAFGRGSEECQALAENGIPFEVVPGISSALAVPAYAGIPVTHRQVATSFTVVTGHTAGADDYAIDWARIPEQGTLVILMGVKQLRQIAADLIAHGRSPHTPVALIEQGTTPHQRVLSGTLADIAEIAHAQHASHPAVIVVGEVAALHEQLAWFEPQVAGGKYASGKWQVAGMQVASGK
jgi:uroporphyrin-III C-methyltransferase